MRDRATAVTQQKSLRDIKTTMSKRVRTAVLVATMATRSGAFNLGDKIPAMSLQ